MAGKADELHVNWMIKNFPKELRRDAKIMALKEEITLRELVIRAIKSYIEKG